MDCPWCRKSVDFFCQQIFDWRALDGSSFADYLQVLEDAHWRRGDQRNVPLKANKGAKDRINAYGFGTCPKCWHPVIVLFTSTLRDLIRLCRGEVDSHLARTLFAAEGIELRGTLPAIARPSVPANAPEKVKEIWPATLASLERGDPPSRIVTECRSILDVCLKELGADKGTRKQRIELLKERYILTQELADWGKILWDDGNDAVHDIVADRKAAERHVEYLKLFFQIAFELRHQITERKIEIEGLQNPSA